MDQHHDDLGLTARKRGKRSAASLNVVPIDAKARRPEPPGRLTADQKAIWREIVEKLRGGWFYSSEPLLEAYVCVVSQERQLHKALQAAEVGSRRHTELLRLSLAVTAQGSSLATKLRLTPRSTHDRNTVKAVPSAPKVWNDVDPPVA
jgi:hypothetical protein